MPRGDELDPKNLIREAYRIEGISEPECRSIFLDWALSLKDLDPSRPSRPFWTATKTRRPITP